MSTGTSSETRARPLDQAPSRPASTAVITRSRGGIGGAWWTRPMRARSALSGRAPICHGRAPSSSTRPSLARSAVAAMRSRLVLPAPDGPMTATRAPRSTVSVTPCSARWPLGCTRPTSSSASAASAVNGCFKFFYLMRPADLAAASMPS
jgi:hypothetical protein